MEVRNNRVCNDSNERKDLLWDDAFVLDVDEKNDSDVSDNEFVLEDEDEEFEIFEILPNHHDDNDDAKEAEEEAELPPEGEKKAFYEQLILSITADERARDKSNPFAVQFVEICERHCLIETPIGRYTRDLKRLKRTHNAGGYAWVKDTDQTLALQKIGQYGDEIARLEYYAKDGHDLDCFKRLWDRDNMPKAAGEQLEAVYQQYINVMSNDPDLATFTRLFFQQLGEHKGDRIGPKRTIWNCLLEQGLCLKHSIGNPFEILMFQQQVADTWYRLATEFSVEAAEKALAKIMAQAKRSDKGFMHGIMGWKPNIRGDGSKVVATFGIVRDRSKMSNPLPFPAIRDAKTAEECYDTSRYTPLHKRQGRQHVREIIQALLNAPFGIVFLDTNRVVFAEDEHFDGTVYDFLLVEFGLTEVLSILFGEIRIFVDESGLHAVTVHGPLCVSTSHLQKLIVKVRRALSEAVLNNIARMFRGEPLLAEDMDTFNPINGALTYQVFRYGLHSGARQASCAMRNFSSDKATNYFLIDFLRKTKTSDHPVAENLRYAINSKRDPVTRSLNKQIILQARRLVSGMTEDNGPAIYQHVAKLFESNNATSGSKTWRWKALLKDHVVLNSDLYNKLVQLRKDANKISVNSNMGNRTVGVGRGNKPHHTKQNNDVMEVIVSKYGPNGTEPGAPFWIKGNRNSVRPPDGTVCNDGKTTFPGKHKDVYDSMVFFTFKDRLSERKEKKENLRQINVQHRRTKYTGISPKQVKDDSNTHDIIAGPEDAGYYLLQLREKQQKRPAKSTVEAPPKKKPRKNKKKPPPKSTVEEPPQKKPRKNKKKEPVPRWCVRHNTFLPRDQFRKVRTNLCLTCEQEDDDNIQAGTHKRCSFGKHVAALSKFKSSNESNCMACIALSAEQKRQRKRNKQG